MGKQSIRLLFQLLCSVALAISASPLHAKKIYLSGKGPEDAKLWDFKVSDGRKAGEWHKIPVPANWEQHGFGYYDYGYRQPEGKKEESGLYRTTFTIPEEYATGYYIRLVFEGSMTMTSVRIDGTLIGEPNQGGYNRFFYPLVTPVQKEVKIGQEVTMEVEVAEKPTNESVDTAEREADYWVFGGIYRPVYLEILPLSFIDRMAIAADHEGSMRVDVITQMHGGYYKRPKAYADELRLQVLDSDGNPFGEELVKKIPKIAGVIPVEMSFNGVKTWSPEHPNLYRLKAGLYFEDELIHEKIDTFGFRTFEVRPGEGFFLNGENFLVKGVNRNSFHPDTARALTSEKNRFDAEMIKSMNANLVRSHQTADREFVDLCNELGLLVVSEVTQWQSPAMDFAIAQRIVFDNVTRHHNDPSVIFWANGNEAGFNLDADQLFHFYDLQKRPILHPWSFYNGIYTWHYPTHDEAKKNLDTYDEIYFATEFLHGLYDGGHGAGLREMWDLMVEYPQGVGVVLWCWADHGIKRTDLGGILDTDGNHSADGIVGPYGELEASYFTIRDIWSPVQIPVAQLPEDFKGVLPVENHSYHSELKDFGFQWEVVDWSDPREFGSEAVVAKEGSARFIPNADDAHGTIEIPQSALKKGQLLSLRAFDPYGREVMHWQWSLGFETELASGGRPTLEKGERWIVRQEASEWTFDPETGMVLSLTSEGAETTFGNGPKLYVKGGKEFLSPAKDWSVSVKESGGAVQIHSKDPASGASFEWIFEKDKPVVLNYDYGHPKNSFDYAAVGFDFADAAMHSKRWLGRGPYPVWSNRMDGPQFGVWENEYNEGGAGFNWVFPEFKGVFDAVDWIQLKLNSGSVFTMKPAASTPVGVSRPVKAPKPVEEEPLYPEGGGLFLFHKIPGIGDKFKTPDRLTPLGGPAKLETPLSGQVLFEVNPID